MSILLDALRSAQDARDRQRGIPPVERAVDPAPPSPPEPRPASPLFALGLVVAIFLGVVAVWHSQPWRAPPKTKIDASGLKIERSLDLTRKGGAARSSPPDPAPSK